MIYRGSGTQNPKDSLGVVKRKDGKSSPDTSLFRRLEYFFNSDELQPYIEVTNIIMALSTAAMP